MFRSTFLAPSHYAGKWVIPDEDQHYDLAAVNALGYAYATAPDSPAKEAKLLEVMECFHGYLMKYLCMIVRGTIPPANSRAGRDAKELLRTLAPRCVKFTKPVVDGLSHWKEESCGIQVRSELASSGVILSERSCRI
jgi:hypothetical protein